MRIVGIDPGGTIGVAFLATDSMKPLWVHGLHVSGMSGVDAMVSLLKEGGPTEVVIERFTITPRTLQGSRQGIQDTLDAIGALKYACHQIGLMPFTQTPAQAKSAYSDATLKEFGLYDRVSGPHERDALRHALLHARTRGFWDGRTPAAEVLA